MDITACHISKSIYDYFKLPSGTLAAAQRWNLVHHLALVSSPKPRPQTWIPEDPEDQGPSDQIRKQRSEKKQKGNFKVRDHVCRELFLQQKGNQKAKGISEEADEIKSSARRGQERTVHKVGKGTLASQGRDSANMWTKVLWSDDTKTPLF